MARFGMRHRMSDRRIGVAVFAVVVGCGRSEPQRPSGPATVPVSRDGAVASRGAAAAIPVEHGGVSFLLDTRIARGATPVRVEGCRLENPTDKPDGVAPSHLAFHLGPGGEATRPCPVPDFERAGLYVFSADEFRRELASARVDIAELSKLLRRRVYKSGDPVPFVPFVDASFAIAERAAFIDFSSGSGLLLLVELSIEPDTLGRNLSFVFQGLTRDGKQYILGIFPAKTEVAIPPMPIDPEASFQDLAAAFEPYRREAAARLAEGPDHAFTPRPSWLEAMLGSLRL